MIAGYLTTKSLFVIRICVQLPDAIHFRKFVHWAPVHDMEFAFVVDHDYSNIVEACKVNAFLSKRQIIIIRFRVYRS